MEIFKSKWFFMIVFGLFSLELFSQGELPEGLTIIKVGNKYNVEFNLPNYEFDTMHVIYDNGTFEDFYDIVLNDEFGIIDTVGLPQIPQLTFLFVIPYDDDVPNINIQHIHETEQFISVRLYPFQEPWPTNIELSERPFFINQSYYTSNGISYNPVIMSEPFVIAGVKGIRVTINPFVYTPAQNKLIIRNNISFEIETVSPYYTKSSNVPSLESYFNSLFVNFEPSSSKDLTYGNYLIITAPQFEELINRFANYKANIGYTVTVVTTAETGTTTDNIKDHIQNMYDNIITRPVFVLLVGDTDEIPNWIGSHDENPPTDLNYSLLEGDDNVADVFLGRFSVGLDIELENIINKTIFMETNVQNLPKDVVLAADFDCMGYFRAAHNSVKSVFENKGYNWHKLYATKKDDDFCIIQVPNTHPASTADLHNAINNNTTFYLYSGHGSVHSISDPEITVYDIMSNTFTNSTFPFTFSFACLTNRFTENVCVGEAWMRHPNCGVTFYGASITTYYGTDKKLEKKIFNKAFDNENMEQIGTMIALGMQNVLNSIASNSRKTRYVEMYNLLGDPSLNTSGIGGCLTDFIFYHSVTYGSGSNVIFSVDNRIETALGNSEFIVELGANVELAAGEEIMLLPGTTAEGNFEARIESCTSNSFSRSIRIDSPTYDIIKTLAKSNIDKNEYRMTRVYPNPFIDNTTIEYSLSKKGNVNIEVYNLLGVKILSQMFENMQEGKHSYNFIGRDLKNGIYIIKIHTLEYKETNFILKQ
jgi:hypothetical protein